MEHHRRRFWSANPKDGTLSLQSSHLFLCVDLLGISMIFGLFFTFGLHAPPEVESDPGPPKAFRVIPLQVAELGVNTRLQLKQWIASNLPGLSILDPQLSHSTDSCSSKH